MIDRYKPGVYVGIGVGIWFMGAGGSMVGMGPEWAQSGLTLGLVGWGILIFGCVCYAQAKGHSGWFGLLGLLGLLGPLILFFFPDRHPTPRGVRPGQPASPFAARAAQPPRALHPTPPVQTSSGPYPTPPATPIGPALQPRPASHAGLKVLLWVLVGIAGFGMLCCAGVLVAASLFFRSSHQRWETEVQEYSIDWPDVPDPTEMGIPQPEPPGKALADGAPLKVGDPLLARWAGQWHPVRIVEVMPGGWVRVHWAGREDLPEMVLPPSQLRAPSETPDLQSPTGP
jgi:hypothetical protein